MCLVWAGVPGPEGVYLVLGGVVLGGVPGSRGCTWSWGVYLVPGGVPSPGGCTWSRGVYLVPGGVPGLGGVPGPGGVSGPRGWCQVLPPVNRITHTCKNITLPQLRCGQ